MTKTSKPLRVTPEKDGRYSFQLNTSKPSSVKMLGNGLIEVNIANAIFEIDPTKDYLSIKAKEIAKSIEGLDSGDIYCEEDGSIMVVD